MTKPLGSKQGAIARGVAIWLALLLCVLARCERLLAFVTFEAEFVPIFTKGSLALSYIGGVGVGVRESREGRRQERSKRERREGGGGREGGKGAITSWYQVTNGLLTKINLLSTSRTLGHCRLHPKYSRSGTKAYLADSTSSSRIQCKL